MASRPADPLRPALVTAAGRGRHDPRVAPGVGARPGRHHPGGTVVLVPTRPEATTVTVDGSPNAVSTTEVDDGGGSDPFRVALVAMPDGPVTLRQRGPDGEELASMSVASHPPG